MKAEIENENLKIQSGLSTINNRIRKAMEEAGRFSTDSQAKLIAVSKFHSANAIKLATKCGQWAFGESYLQEALSKQDELSSMNLEQEIEWHFVGHIQSRKAKEVVGRFALLHTVDTIKLAKLLNKFAEEKNIIQSVLIQVNIGNEEQKSGVKIEELDDLAQYILECSHLKLDGLMCLPPVFDAGLAARPHFAHLRNLRDELSKLTGANLAHLSMGMSGDLEAAILEGASLLRIGTDIFGNRNS